MAPQFDATTTGIAFLVLLGALIGGTLASPMTTATVAMVSVGLALFGLATLVLGVKHGEYRARR